MLKAVLILVAVVIAGWAIYRTVTGDRLHGRGTMAHEAPPMRTSEPPFDVEAMMQQIKESDYYADLQPLQQFVDGRTVLRSESGNAGFILYLDNGTWAATFREHDRVGHAMGTGEPGDTVRSAISSAEYGDASDQIPGNIPYADQPCDVSREVAKSHGRVLSGLAFGLDSFNYAFADGHELDFKLVDDKNGKPAFRVFWEKW
jgi:prepilin-type processing-associated H-X9-DG protein